VYKMLGSTYCTMLCNNAEYKKMGPDLSWVQLNDVHNRIKIYTKHWLGLLTYYDTSIITLVNNKLGMRLNSSFPLSPDSQNINREYYRNDISIKSSNVKLNINDVCNLIRTLKARSMRAF